MEITTTVIWAIGIIAFVVLEAVTYQMVSLWFAIGAVGGIIASALGAPFNVQMIIFIALSVVFLIALRPVSMKILKTRGAKTNVDGLIGKEVLITKDIDNINGVGEGKINGMTWSVRSLDNAKIPANTTAVVEKVEGVKLIVTKKGE